MDEHSQSNNPTRRQSSLPASLLPHLVSGPRDSSTRTIIRRESPDDIDGPTHQLPALPRHDQFRLLSPLEPVHRYPAPLHSAPPFEHHPRPFASFNQRSLDPRDRQHARTLPEPFSSTPMHRAYDPLSSLTQRYPSPSPVYNDRGFEYSSRPSMSRNTGQHSVSLPGPRELFPFGRWREGEAGPSSLLRPIPQDNPAASHRRASGQALRGDILSSNSYTRESDPFARDLPFPDRTSRAFGDRDSYHSERSMPRDYPHTSSRSFERLPGPSQLLNPSLDDPPYAYDRPHPERRESYQFPAVGSLSISAPSPSYTRDESPDTPSLHRSDSRSGDVASTDGDGSSKGKRRREESVETDDYARRTRNPRKTAVACNFCRGRKLRCNGEKPSCYNCTVRKIECEYVTVQRRRGPGKAPKGSRSKKPTATRSEPSASTSTSTGDRPSNPVPEYELDALAPEVRQYTSVLALETFDFQPPSSSPQYPSASESPSAREYYSRTRTPRSRETSSEDRSDGEPNS